MTRWLNPALIVGLFLCGYIGLSVARNEGDVTEMARLGITYTIFHNNGQGAEFDRVRALYPPAVPAGLEGYDGQYAYFIALNNLNPALASTRVMDVPAYRYQRILLPALAWLLSLGGQPTLLPWSLIIVNLIAQVAGTWLIGEIMASFNANRWYALTYGLWVGLVYGVRLATAEPLAYALVAGAVLMNQRGRPLWSAGLYALALFAKETTLLFVGAQLLCLMLQHEWRSALRFSVISLLPFAVFQLFLFLWFSRLGLGSGGYLGTPWEAIPYMGLWRIGAQSILGLVVYSVLYVPMIVLPSAWGVATAVWRLAHRDWAFPVLALFASAVIFPVTPFSTWSEPNGLVRLIPGFLLAVLLFGAYVKSRRVLNYAMFWLAALVMLVNER